MSAAVDAEGRGVESPLASLATALAEKASSDEPRRPASGYDAAAGRQQARTFKRMANYASRLAGSDRDDVAVLSEFRAGLLDGARTAEDRARRMDSHGAAAAERGRASALRAAAREAENRLE
ncbi:MAG: hypothetical protein ACI9CA_000035 [Natronomonas sp.]|jgi:hypothetical protein